MNQENCQGCGAPRKIAAAYCHLCGLAAVTVVEAKEANPEDAAPTKKQQSRTIARVGSSLAGVTLMVYGTLILVTLLFPPASKTFWSNCAAQYRLFVGAGVWVLLLLFIGTGFLFITEFTKIPSWNGKQVRGRQIGGAFALFIIFITWRHLSGPFGHNYGFMPDNLKGYGGYVGAALSWSLVASVGAVGGYVVLVALTVIALLYLTDFPMLHSRVSSRAELSLPQTSLVEGKSQESMPASVNIHKNGVSDGTEWCVVCGRAKGYGEKFCPSCGRSHDEPPAPLKIRKSRKKGPSKTSVG